VTIEEARKRASAHPGWGWNYEPGDTSLTVDGNFTADELEALAIVLRDDQKRAANLNADEYP
jgi:hypothetical protein